MPGRYVGWRRVNVQVRDGIDPAVAVARVATVMSSGRVSGDDKYYCWVTTFTDGTIVVTRGPNKRENTDSFIVYKERRNVEVKSEEAGDKAVAGR
jgi:hypothetical protein